MEENKILLPHHEQKSLCTTRLPYRQGRKLTAVKVYSITKESNHLLIFGVPSLSLRQETKAQFSKFGKLLQFNISKNHSAEVFTDTYHAQFEKIQSARIAKRMLDTKNFYGGLLHVTYAPEMETIEETRLKLLQRQENVLFRLKNLEKESKIVKSVPILEEKVEPIKMNMGVVNTVVIGPQVPSKKQKKYNKNNLKKNFNTELHLEDSVKDQKVVNNSNINIVEVNNTVKGPQVLLKKQKNDKKNDFKKNCNEKTEENSLLLEDSIKDLEVIDCTNVEEEVISNINEALNYNKFGTEVVRSVPQKRLNKIEFNFNKKSRLI